MLYAPWTADDVNAMRAHFAAHPEDRGLKGTALINSVAAKDPAFFNGRVRGADASEWAVLVTWGLGGKVAGLRVPR